MHIDIHRIQYALTNNQYISGENIMNQSITTRVIATSALIAITTLLSVTSLTASAARGVSQGGGIKCGWVVTSSNPATGAQTLIRVCSPKGA